MRRGLFTLLLVALIGYIYWDRTKKPAPSPVLPPPPPAPASLVEPEVEIPESEPQTFAPAPQPSPHVVRGDAPNKKLALHYKIDNGMFIVMGDVVAGAVIPGENPPEDGLVEMEPLKLWPNVIPYHIQPDVGNKQQVLEAIKMFEGTAVQFVPENGQEDVLVFERGEKNCLSYVGQVTHKQQIWISPMCKPDDIAHEIMHALGFVHEQNRADRDGFIDVFPDNIEDEFRYNFIKLPSEYMRVSGLAEFDFKSLMMYPAWMFAKGGRNTMEPKRRDQLIDPQPRLSAGDVERLNRAYRR